MNTQRADGAPKPIWFGPVTEPLAGFLHEPPSGTQAGGVLICAPFGYEAICAHRTLRELAALLAANGKLVLRFDYFGTGESAGFEDGADSLDCWKANVEAGLAELRRRGVARPALVGMRLGAALAYDVAISDPETGPLVLWAPVTSGRRFYRELRAQAAVTPGGVVGDGSLNVHGSRIGAPLLNELKTWQPMRGAAGPRDVLLVQSPGWRDVEQTADDLLRAGVEYAYMERDGIADVLESDAEMAKVPVQLVESIGKWLFPRTTGRPAHTSVQADPICVHDTGGAALAERIVEIGASRLYGVLTSPVTGSAQRGVLFLNNGVAPAAGPGRAWVEFARALAAAGVCSLRFDFSGLGDSPDRTARRQRSDRPYTARAADEVIAAIGLLRSRGVAEVTVVGLCSGAATGLRTAARRDAIDAVVAINPSLFNQPYIGIGPRWWPVPAMVSWLMRKGRLREPALRLPRWCWALLDRLGRYSRPATILDGAAARGTRVTLILSPEGASLLDLLARGGGSPGDGEDADAQHTKVFPGLDHSMFDRASRAQVFDYLSRELMVDVPAQP